MNPPHGTPPRPDPLPGPSARPNPTTAPGRLQGAALAALIAGVVAAVAPSLTQPNEGLVQRPYLDPAAIKTVCYGETEGVEDRIYSRDECATRLRTRMAKDYAPAIIRCVPDFADPARRFAFGAALDASYNAGPAAFCRSPMARAFNAGRWAEGCAAFRGWYITARVRGKPTVLPGLERRRREEAQFCMTGRRS